ncbi:MAG: amino acid permease [Selenomonadaceae bacterium]|nr:amino acid permease [Selenomonadaceae bacterium]
MNRTETEEQKTGLRPYLSPLHVWALAFGCAVGWGAFVMPGTVFLPIAGPLGVAIGMAIGAAVMLIIGLNYHYMMNRYPDAGGTYAFAKHVFGHDHGFMGAWFLLLVFIAITWANATALPLVFRNLLGTTFQVGFHYQVAGYDVYLGEALLSLSAIWLFGCVCMRGGRLAASLQTVLAILLFGGILVDFGAALSEHGPGIFTVAPPFSPDHSPLLAVFSIVVLAPWAFAGFESISNSTEEFRFSPKKSFAIMVAAVVAGAMCYVFLSALAAASVPKAYGSWPFYLHDLGNLSGLAALPTFHAANVLLGHPGLLILGVTILSGIITGLVGNTIGASRLIYAMARDNLLPAWFSKLNGTGTPRNAILFIMLLSLPIPFLGRTAISWIIDVNTIGATIAYAYTSAVAFKAARDAGDSLVQCTGLLGGLLSAFFFLYFMVPGFWSVSTLSTESYLIFIVWSILGFVFFRYIFQRDTENRFVRSTVVWISLVALIFFTSMLWLRQSTHETAEHVLGNLSAYYLEEMNQHGVYLNETQRADAEFYLEKQMDTVSDDLTMHNLLQIVLIAISLFIMFNIYNLMMRREKAMEVQKAAAEQSNKAKSTFFFNMSHDIRTPMNAIIGYVELSRRTRSICDTCPKKGCEHCVPEKLDGFMGKIDVTSQHLLSLINDILEMSRIENGKMELEIATSNIVKAMDEVRDLFVTQMEAKGLTYTVDASNVRDKWVLCDTKRLNRVLLNLISNAYKFTPEGGEVRVTLSETGVADGRGFYELRVKDTGMGMSPEFAATVFDAYTRDRSVGNIQGTGLGMSITKSIVDLMGGTIEVKTKQGKGTEFVIHAAFEIASDSAERDSAERDSAAAVDFKDMRLLLVEDIDMNREIANMILSEAGFLVDTAENGKIAVDKVAASKPGDYQAILMDIQMPVMNGYDAAKAIRALKNPGLATIPIIAMTANAFSEDVQDAMAAGMNGHIAKPLDVPKMMETLAEVLGHRNGGTA